MSAERRRVTNTEAWTQWENQVVNGAFPLRRFLGCSNHSGVFLTEYKAKNLADAAIKFVRVDALQAKAQLAQWGTAALLSHPHVLRLFEVGRYPSGGHEFVFVVMEYAEQTLAQILRQRALTADEVQELLLPTLDTLAFLHQNRLVHGQVKPSNFLAVNDRLKLAGDTFRPAGYSATGIVRTSAYDPPELKESGISAAGDIWSLGMTLLEALTQQTETASLPASVPAPFADTVRRCLSPSPVNRPTIIELGAQYRPASQTDAIPEPQPPVREAPQATAVKRAAVTRSAEVMAPSQSSPKRPWALPAIGVVLLLALAVWIGLHFFRPSQAPLQPTVESSPPPVTPSTIAKSTESDSRLSNPVSRPPERSSLPPAATSPSVLHEVTPDVPPAIREKIQGRVYVTMRVLVDPSGIVVGALPENPGPSKYFARLADNAAREWQFAPADNQAARVWLLRFEFTRGGVAVRATAQ